MTILCVLLLSLIPTAEPESAEFNGHRYALYDEVEELSWPAAKKFCEGQGGYLAVVGDLAEAEFLASFAADRYMYLGATDEVEEGSWLWVDGSAMEFTYWMDGQPNGYGGTENYLATYDGGKWVDVDASGDGFWMPTGFICEWDPA